MINANSAAFPQPNGLPEEKSGLTKREYLAGLTGSVAKADKIIADLNRGKKSPLRKKSNHSPITTRGRVKK